MIYLISYTPNYLYSQENIHDFITNHLNGSDWWFYTNIYLLDTTLTIPQITSSLRGKYPGLMHFIAKVDLRDNGGVLPREAWDWINKKTKQPVRLTSLPPLSPLEAYSKYKANLSPIKQYDPQAIKKALDELIRRGRG